MESGETFGGWLRREREQRSCSQEALAKAAQKIEESCRIHQPRVAEWEKGAGLPTLRQLGLMAIVLRLPLRTYRDGLAFLEREALSGLPFHDLHPPDNSADPETPTASSGTAV